MIVILACCRDIRRQVPANYILLAFFVSNSPWRVLQPPLTLLSYCTPMFTVGTRGAGRRVGGTYTEAATHKGHRGSSLTSCGLGFQAPLCCGKLVSLEAIHEPTLELAWGLSVLCQEQQTHFSLRVPSTFNSQTYEKEI